ncbi:MAG: hypothetical protein AB1791_07035 [Chloroflexota bacterium]
MEKMIRGIIALVILFSGLALLPYIDLPSEALSWQKYAGVYDATLTVNYPDGQPGSYFTFTGNNYPPDSALTVAIDGETLGTVVTDSDGYVVFILDTGGALPATYTVSATVDANATASAVIALSPGAPFRPLEGEGPIFSLGARLYLPVVFSS